MLRVLAGSGVLRPYPPRRVAAAAVLLARWGAGPAGGFAAMSTLVPQRTAVVDDLGELTFEDLDQRSNRLAHSLAARGVGPGSGVAVMCRNHRGFVDASLAAAKLGADIVYLNTAFAAPQLADVLSRERPRLVVHDQEFTALLEEAEVSERVLAWVDESPPDAITLESLIEAGSAEPLGAPRRMSRVVILTSGTTGAPKGAPRSNAGLSAVTALLSRLPMRSGWRTHVAAPLFHTWGWAHFELAMVLGATLVLRRRFDPERALRTVVEERCDAMVVIPVMLQRIMALPRSTLDGHDLSLVKVVATSGSALPGDLGTRWMDQFGDHLYNTYGSTEVAYATIASPEDLRHSPGTAGRPPSATVVRILDEEGHEVARGGSGRIFVRNSILFEGYTGGGGGGKDMVDGLMATGDVGRIDEGGRLVVEGRDDEMIVSGGENVFPQEVEDCLTSHEAVHEAAAVGVDDESWGKRLRAFVVLLDRAEASEDELKDHVRRNLARYKVPREIVFVEELPRNETGKVVKRELSDRAES